MSDWLASAWEAAGERDRALDRATQKARGVVHTPPPLARYVVKHLAMLLHESGLAERLDDPRLTYVDPAVGTGIFPAALLEHGVHRMIGLDLDPQALAITARLFEPHQLELTLTNPLASLTPHPRLEENVDGPVVVIGNPPWAGRSQSRGVPLSDALLQDFARDETGASLGERKIGVLSDDYVRFVRWALELVTRRRDGGAFALVTNASWIDGPIHRGMRRVLSERLDRLEVIDLGGSALVGRNAKVRDENLFGVRPAASLIFGARSLRAATRSVHFGALTGSRADKLARLEKGQITAPLALTPPHYALRPALAVPTWYAEAPSLPAWLPFHREGLQTNRDALVIDRDREALAARAEAIVRGEIELPARRHFDPEHARRALRDELARGLAPIRPVAYRPFDDRFYLSSAALCHRPRPDLERAIERSSLVLVSTRQDRGSVPFQHLILTRFMPDNCLLSLRSSCRARAFPSHDPLGAPNLGPAVSQALIDRLGALPPPEDVLLWIAAHLGAPHYVTPLDQALRLDYPRVPLPPSPTIWQGVIAAGRELAACFLAPVERAPGKASGPPRIGHHPLHPGLTARLDQARRALDQAHRTLPGDIV